MNGPRIPPQRLPPDMPDALCAQTDPDTFFPEVGGSTRAAKDMCHRCEHEATCLIYALEQGERFGIWGGTSELERRRMKKAAS